MSKSKRIFNASVSVFLCLVIMFGVFAGSVVTVSASNLNENDSDYSTGFDDCPISSEEILNALNNAEIVDAREDSEFVLADSSVEISDDYFPATADISEVQAPEQSYDESASNDSEKAKSTVGDSMVYMTQKWLNQEYGDVPGFGSVPENGKTGWDTVYGLLRALQHELGITSLANSFGPTTSSRYEQNLLQRQDGVTDRKFAILQGALWCKGYAPGYKITENPDGTITFKEVFDADVEKAVKQLQKDAGIANPDGVVSLNLMKALMSMDSFKLLPSSYGSDANIRAFQQWMNRNYEAYTGLSPCDGVYGRNTNKALIYALQAEEGLPISVANGNFGKTTQLCCPELPYFENSTAARKYPGTASSEFYSYSNIVSFTKLLQFALYVNGFGNGDFDGVFDNGTKQNVRAFQEHHAITVTGKADKSTWLSLFISCGDRNRSAKAADCATILSKPKAEALYANGYRYIGRYLTGTYNGGINKALTREEAQIILDAGLRFFPIYQTSARKNEYFTKEQGASDAKDAIQHAEELGLPQNTIIYFAVDFDAMDYQITSNIIPYFQAVHEEMSASIYKTGIYGARNVCTRVSNRGYACSSFVGNMSTGFSGNLGFKMPSNWAFDQFTDKDQSGNYLSISSPDGSFAIDKDGFSGRDHGVGKLDNINKSKIDTDDINFGSTDEEIMYGPTVNIMGKPVPLFQLNLSFDLDCAHIETHQDIETGDLEVLIGVNVYGEQSETMGYREKADQYNEAYYNTKKTLSCIRKNPRELNKVMKDFKGSLYDRGTKVGFGFDSYIFGYMKLDKNGTAIEGELGIIGTGNASISYPVAAIPALYFKIQIEGSIQSGLKLIYHPEADQYDVSGDIDFAARLDLGLEENLMFANAYVGGSGELSCSAEIPFISFRDSFKVRGKISAFFEWNVLDWGTRYDWNFVDTQLYPRDEANNLFVSQKDLKFIAPISKTADISALRDSDAFKSNVQIYAAPQLINLGNDKMFMLYIDDSENRSAENRCTLMYSMYNGATWSIPQPVLDDGTSDFEPKLCADGNGGVHILWQNANTVFNENITLDQMAEQMDLYYTHWNGTSFSNATAITTNNTNYEMSHQIASSGGDISVIWQQNTENDPMAMSGVNTIYRRQFTNGSWQNTETISENLSIINSLGTAYSNDKNIIVYSAKTSDDFSTMNDLELFYFDGAKIERLTNDNVPDYSVNLSNDELYWISDGSIASIKMGNMDTKQIISTVNGNVTKIKVISNAEDKKSIVWKQENEERMYFYGIDYNAETSTFGLPYPLTTDNGVVRGWDACLQSDGQIELAFCYADYLSEPDNGKPYGTLNLIQKPMEEFCDISVNPIATYTGEIGSSKNITLVTEVYNNGSRPIESVEVKLIGSNGEILQTSIVDQVLNVSEFSEIKVPFTLPTSISRTDYKIQIRPVQDEDILLSDNEAEVSIGFADLSIEKVEETRTNSGRQLNVTIKNKGFDTVGSGTLQIHSDSYDGTLIGSSNFANIQPNSESTVSFTLDSSYSESSASEAFRLIYISLNTTDIESDYSNNTLDYHVYPDYSIRVQVGTTGGTVTGNGIFAKDGIAEVTATPNPGFVFQGWYENDVKILEAESTYSFSVVRNRILEAKFSPLDVCDIIPISTKPGIVDSINKYLIGIEEGGNTQDYFTVTNGGSMRKIVNDFGMNDATGAQIQLVSENGIITDTYTIVVLGDVNGDSAVDMFDASILNMYLNGYRQLEGAYLEAADLNRDGVVDNVDYDICMHWSVGDYEYTG